MTSAILYAAKSTEDRRGSIPTQLADCRAAAEAEGRDVVAVQRRVRVCVHGQPRPGARARDGARRTRRR
jgi:hypothetical protein